MNVRFSSSVWLAFSILPVILGFNIETRNPVEKRGEPGSYFGFSVALHKTEEQGDISKSFLLIGAPLDENLQPNTTNSGALYKCPVPRPTEIIPQQYCEQVITDGMKRPGGSYMFYDSDRPKDLLPPGDDEKKAGQWLGVSVRSQKPGGIVVVCAHRYIKVMQPRDTLENHQFSPGLCYLLKPELNVEDDIQPCSGRSVATEHEEYGYCQAGTSLAVLSDATVVMGAPGPFTWRGTIYVKDMRPKFFERDQTVYHGPLEKSSEPIDKYSYVGMSVTAGRFLDKNTRLFASGAPRAKLHGAVYFLHKNNNGSVMDIPLIINGEQFGSSFGYEILSEDINQDGYDDLVVGAPFFFNNTEGGAVYIYYNLRSCTNDLCQWDQMMTGVAESRYGFSMTSLGDINRDGYPDVAIGAPYEGGGAIYIYLGSKNGLVTPHAQKIHPEVENLRTIGYSLSGGLDMDGNGYPDLLTGAYESDRAYLYRTRQIVDIKVEVFGELKNINTSRAGCSAQPYANNTCFSFQTCFTITSNDTEVQRIQCEVEETYDKVKYSRVWIHDEKFPDKQRPRKKSISNISKDKNRYCTSHTVFIRDGIRDILSPITFKVNYTLTDASPNTPILNRTSVERFQVTFQKECGTDDICQSYLVVKGKVVENLDLSEHEPFWVNITVNNERESAYEANLYIIHPLALSYVNVDQHTDGTSCTTKNDTLVICNLGNPFKNDAFLDIKFEINQKETKSNVVDLDVFVNSTSEELSNETRVKLKSVIRKRAEVKITGGATSHVKYGGEVKGESAMHYFEDIGQRIWHKYQVENQGPWHVEDMQVLINWPHQVGTESGEGKWLLYLEGVPEFETAESGFCRIASEIPVNPLNLTSLSEGNDSPPENLEVLNYTVPNVRRRRDVEYVVKADSKKAADGKERLVVTMDCDRGSAKCLQIICTVQKLRKGGEATINIKSRIWNSTLIEDYSKVDWVRIVSRAYIKMTDPTIIQDDVNDDSATAVTLAYPMVAQADSGVTIWIIIGAVLAGLLLLIILVIVLYKMGFFKRNRINDHTLSGNLTKQSESETLLDSNK